MKKYFIFLICFSLAIIVKAQIEVYITDSDVFTNIRNAPNGRILKSVPNKDFTYVFKITEVKNKWLKIDKSSFVRYTNDGENEMRGLLDDIDEECWIHNTVAKTHIARPGAIPVEYKLHNSPSTKSKVIYIGNRQKGDSWNDDLLIILEIRGEWKKVRTPKGIVGWTNAELAADLWSA